MKRRADGRYQKRITLSDGTAKILYSKAKSEREAIKDFNEQMLNLEQKKKKERLFSEVADNWNTEYRERVSDINYRKNTRASYENIVKYFKKFYIEEITAVEVNKFINTLILKHYAQKTVSGYKSVLNMIFKYAILNGFIENNPVTIISVPSNLPKKPRKLPTDEEIKVVCEHYKDFDLLPYFLLHTGLRMSEALAIDIKRDIDFKNNLITVNKHLIHDNNTPVIENKTKTESSKRTTILLERLAEKIPHRKGLLFCNNDGSPLTKKQLQCRWENYQKKYGVSVTAHQLRHGYATMLFEAGVDLKDAQELMGHSDIKTTQQIYTHIRNKRKTETAEKLNAFQF